MFRRFCVQEGNLKSFVFTKTDRILKRSDFIRLSESGKKLHDKHFLAVFGPGLSGQSRMGITVTKKVGNAVVRNRIKRLSREFFRLNKNRLTDHRDINIIAKKTAAILPTSEVFSSLQNLFDKMLKVRIEK